MRVLLALLVLIACLRTSTAKRKDAVETMEKGASFLAQAGTDGRGLPWSFRCASVARAHAQVEGWWYPGWAPVAVQAAGAMCMH